MRDKIWYDIVHTKHGEIFLSHYLKRQKRNIRFFKIFTLLFSTSGVFSWAIWQNGILTMISCIVVSIIQLLNLIENQLVLNDKDIEKVGKLREKYLEYFQKIEKLWNDYETGIINESEASSKFYSLKKIYNQIEALDNQVDILRINKKLKNLIDKESTNYFNQYHS